MTSPLPVYALHSCEEMGHDAARVFPEASVCTDSANQACALLLLSLVAILCGTSLAILLAMRISQPIGRLVAEAQGLAYGAYQCPVQVDAQDEIGYLAHAFEQMRIALLRHLKAKPKRNDV